MLEFIKKLFGDKKSKDILPLKPIVEEINKFFEEYNALNDDELRALTGEFKQRIQDETAELRGKVEELQLKLQSNDDFDRQAVHDELDEINNQLDDQYDEILDDLLPRAFAVVKQTCKRLCGQAWRVMGRDVVWEMVPYDVQLMGGIVLHQGRISEMATGEGKTLVATLPLFLNSLSGRGVHLVTVNDYLAQRDSEWMSGIFKFHNLSVGVILTSMEPGERRDNYARDVTYGTNNEFGFDYLRDNMSLDKEQQVQPIHNFAIVDEVDSVLIDEARTPLIISGAVEVDDHKYNEMKPLIERLYRLQSNLVAGLVQEAESLLKKTDDKEADYEAGKLIFRAQRGLPKNNKLQKVLSDPINKKLMQDIESEFLRDKSKNMYIIDDELYFVIDERNNSIDLTEKGREELAKGSKSSKDFFVLTDLGTEISKFENNPEISDEQKAKMKDELYRDYSEKSDRIHTLNQLLKAYTLFEKDDEYVVTDEGKVAIVDEFTGRVLAGRRYSDGLHQAIEAKENVHVERDTQTLATITLQNYFRMYKKLAGMTGTAETEEGEFHDIYKLDVVVVPSNRPLTRSDEDDAIFRTKREKYNAVIEQIEELRRQGRPVLVGTTSVDVSEIISKMLKRKGVPHNVLNAKQHQREAEVVASAGQIGAVTIATNMAGRGTDIKLGAGVVDTGGLYILGTERHESRRIDRQLRGRSGRQGDPGTTKFYLSLEDDLMRLFGSDRMASVMQRLGLKEGEVIEHPLITKSVERAQKKVEENNYATRKRLLDYDDVMNQQRSIIYSRRNKVLHGERLMSEVFEMIDEFCDDLVEKYYDEAQLDKIHEEALHNFMVDVRFTPVEFEKAGKSGIAAAIADAAKHFYKEKEKLIGVQMLAQIERFAFLNVIDNKWKEHLREMDDLKEGIGLRAYGQKDPLIEYKSEAFRMFVELLSQIRNETVMFCFKFFPHDENEVKTPQPRPSRQRMITTKNDATNSGLQGGDKTPEEAKGKVMPVQVEERVGRNEPCPCGSGKKYKHCHGK